MNSRASIALLVLLLSVMQNTAALIEARKVLHIPEKIIGGVIDIVQNHKSKPVPTTQTQVQSQPVYQGAAQQYPWTNSYPNYQGQFQGQGQYNYGTYPTGNYQQGTYPVNSGQVYPSGTVQQGYVGAQGQGQVQGQYQVYPQNQGSQFQGQNQQSFEWHNQQTQFQGQQTGSNGQKPQNQFHGQNQAGQYGSNQHGQFQGQGNYHQVQQTQTGQYTGQNVQTGQFTGENQQSSNFVSQSQQNGQFPVNAQGQGFVQGQGSGWQNGSFQVPGTQQQIGVAPTCVCQAWTKPQADESSGKSEDIDKKIEAST